jgi:hypothetical protein
LCCCIKSLLAELSFENLYPFFSVPALKTGGAHASTEPCALRRGNCACPQPTLTPAPIRLLRETKGHRDTWPCNTCTPVHKNKNEIKKNSGISSPAKRPWRTWPCNTRTAL